MKSLYESILDDNIFIVEKIQNSNINLIKDWVKNNINKSSGRVKVDNKTGLVTLPPKSNISITCPIPEIVKFADLEDCRLTLYKATDDDLAKFEGKIEDKIYSLTVRDSSITSTQFINSIYNVDLVFLNTSKLDISSIKEVGALSIIPNKNISISGCKNLSKVNKISLNGGENSIITIKDDFSSVKNIDKVFFKHVKCDSTIFKNIKTADTIDLNYSSEIDLSSINKLKSLNLTTKHNFDTTLLPKSVDTLMVDSNSSISDIELEYLPKTNYFRLNGQTINTEIFNDKEAIKVINSLNNALGERGGMYSVSYKKPNSLVVPEEVIEYFKKNCKQVKPGELKPNKQYFIISQYKKEYDRMHYIENIDNSKVTGRCLYYTVNEWRLETDYISGFENYPHHNHLLNSDNIKKMIFELDSKSTVLVKTLLS